MKDGGGVGKVGVTRNVPEGTADAGNKTEAHDFVDVPCPEQRQRRDGNAAYAEYHGGFTAETSKKDAGRQCAGQPAHAFGRQHQADEAVRRTECLRIQRKDWNKHSVAEHQQKARNVYGQDKRVSGGYRHWE